MNNMHTVTPCENPFLIGHEKAEAEFLSAFKSGRLAHAWLICGPRGIGKTTLAYRFARFLLAYGHGGGGQKGALFDDPLPAIFPQNLGVSQDNAVSRRIAARSHTDLMYVERAFDEKKNQQKREILINDVRGIGNFLSMSAREGGWRIVMIDAADEMNRHAANAVLKILEEPPRQSILLLIAHRPGLLPPTMRSRCRRLILQPLQDEQVAKLVCRYLPNTSPEDAQELAQLAQGSIGRALALGEKRELNLFRSILTLLDRLPEINIVDLHELADNLAYSEHKEAFYVAIDTIRWWLIKITKRYVRMGDQSIDNLGPWLQVWEKLNNLFDRTVSIDLDRKQVFLNIFLALQHAVHIQNYHSH